MRKYAVIVIHSNQRIDCYIRNEEKAKELFAWNESAFPNAKIKLQISNKDLNNFLEEILK